MENSLHQQKSLEITVPADLHFSAGVREIVSEFCDQNGFNNITKNQLKLIIDELYMNAVRYGSSKTSQVKVSLFFQGNVLTGKIEDFGQGEKQIKKEDLEKIIFLQTTNNVLTKTSGRGLAQIVQNWTDHFIIENNAEGGIRVTFEKNIDLNQKMETALEESTNKLRIESTLLKEYVFAFEGEITPVNLDKNQKTINDFLETKGLQHRIILDFSKLTYCNSTFIGQIADWYNRVTKNKGEIIIRNPNQEILDIIDMVGLTKIIPIQNLNP